MAALAPLLADKVPDWIPDLLREPTWLGPLTQAVRQFVLDHQTGGLFLVIFVEELGVPLPAPGDVAIAYGGYLTTTGAIPYPMAYFAVVGGAVLGSAVNLTITRRYGRPLVQRFGRYIGVSNERLLRAEGIFRRWGPWAIIIGRHIPGMRIALSAISGILGVPYKVFIPCVLVSALIWAAIFLELGRRLGPRVRDLFLLFPAHLVPWIALGLILLVIGYLGYEHGFKPKNHRKPVQEPE